MSDATFATPDLTTFCRLDELGLVAVGQRSNQNERSSLAGLWSLTTGATDAASTACCVTPWCVGSLTNRSGGGRPCWR